MILLNPFQTILVVLIIIALYIFTIYHLVKNEPGTWNKLFWIILIIFLPVIGSMAYWIKALLSVKQKQLA